MIKKWFIIALLLTTPLFGVQKFIDQIEEFLPTPFLNDDLIIGEEKVIKVKQEVKLTVAFEYGLDTDTYRVVLDPQQTTKLFAEVKVPVTKIHYKLGDHFRQGNLLIELEDKVLKSDYKKAAALFDKAESEYEATRELFIQKLASLFEYKEAESNLATAEADLVTAEKNLESTKIYAPYSGVVVSILAEEYELPQPGKELIKIIDDHTLVAKLLVSSSLLQQMEIGKPLVIQVSETGETIKARIARIGGMIDPASSTIKVEAEVANADRHLKAGMTGIASFKRVQ